MSCSYTAGLVVGVKVHNEDLYTEETERGCEHTVAKDVKFCPKCGAPATKRVSKPLPKYDEDEHYGILEVCRICTCDDYMYVVGKVLARVYGDPYEDQRMMETIDPTELMNARTVVEKSLKDDPLLEKGEFGIWLAMYVSY